MTENKSSAAANFVTAIFAKRFAKKPSAEGQGASSVSLAAASGAREAPPLGVTATTAEDYFGATVTAGASAHGVTRRALSDSYVPDFTPAVAKRELQDAQQLRNTPLFAQRAASVLNSNARLQSAVNIRHLGVLGLPLHAEAGGTSLQARKAAEAVQELLTSPVVTRALPHLLYGDYLGYSFAEIEWDRSSSRFWGIKNIHCTPPEWFGFDQRTHAPLLAPAEQGGTWAALESDKWIRHLPRLRPGVPTAAGTAFTAMFYAALANLNAQSWMVFQELFGTPVRSGKYPAHDDSKLGVRNRQVMRQALESLGRESWFMLPDNMQIEFIEAASRGTSTDGFERLARYLDENLVTLQLGGTLTAGTSSTGSGSMALGNVHNEVRADIVRAVAGELAATLQRDLVEPFVRFNFPVGTPVPQVHFHVEEPEDLTALADALAKLVPLGLRVSASEVRERFGLREPKAEEELLAPAATAALPSKEEAKEPPVAAEAPDA